MQVVFDDWLIDAIQEIHCRYWIALSVVAWYFFVGLLARLGFFDNISKRMSYNGEVDDFLVKWMFAGSPIILPAIAFFGAISLFLFLTSFGRVRLWKQS